MQSGKHQSFAEWEIVLEEAGNYEVQVFAPSEFATHKNARYYLYHGRGLAPIEIDLTAVVGQTESWLSLGTFAFSQGGTQKLLVFDNSDVAVSGEARVVVDAIRLIPEGGEPLEDPGAEDPEDPGAGEDPSDTPDTPNPGDEPEDGPMGLVTNGCQSAPGQSPWAAGLFLLMALVAIRRKSLAIKRQLVTRPGIHFAFHERDFCRRGLSMLWSALRPPRSASRQKLLTLLRTIPLENLLP